MAMQRKKINNMSDLTKDLVSSYEQLKAGKITIDEAKAISQSANSIISTCKLQLNYNSYLKSDKKIEFLEY